MNKLERVYFLVSLCLAAGVVRRVVGQFNKLGKHSTPSKGATVLGGKFPPPAVLYNYFVRLGQPLLMKDVLNETHYPAFLKWTDDYLSTRYGDEVVDIERGKKEDRSGENVQLTLAKFVDIYNKSDLYMVHTVPDAMKEEVLVPHSLQCGGFQDNIQDAVVWFSGGETKSVLHYDSLDNINCLLDGQKQLILIDKNNKRQIEESGWVEDGSYSLVDVDSVDPNKFSGIYEAPWYQIDMVKGDCVYIPYRWYHQVYSPPGRNLAVNLWFSHLYWFNMSDCEDASENKNEPLSMFSFASPNQQLRSEFLSNFIDGRDINEPSFMRKCGCENTEDALKLWQELNANNDRHLTWKEMYSFNIEEVAQKFPQCFHDYEIQDENTRTDTNQDLGDDKNQDLGDDKNQDLGDDKNQDLGDDKNQDLGDDKNHDLGDDKNHDLGDDKNHDLGDDKNQDLGDDKNQKLGNDEEQNNLKDDEKLDNLKNGLVDEKKESDEKVSGDKAVDIETIKAPKDEVENQLSDTNVKTDITKSTGTETRSADIQDKDNISNENNDSYEENVKHSTHDEF